MSDIKRIRVAPPKPGHLYPNLSEIESATESVTDTEYTVNSTEAETATLDEKSGTETCTEAEYYVEVGYYLKYEYSNRKFYVICIIVIHLIQDNESEIESEEESGDMNSSLGRSILRVVSEQSFLNKKVYINISN